MKNGFVFSFVFCLVSNTVFAQNNQDIVAIERQADSLYFELQNPRDLNSYARELALRNEALSLYSDTNSEYYKQSLAKKQGSEALLLMQKGDYAKAIESSQKAINLLDELESPDLVFKGYVYRFLYHQYAYSGDWKTAYPLTKKTKQIFLDTLVENHKLVADVEFDIGYAASNLGDINTVINQFEIAKDKYISFQGKNTYDVGEKYMHLSTVYGNIGYYKKELQCMLEANQIWESIDYRDKSYQAISYGNTSSWYLQHGDVEKAEQYLIKREQLIDKNKTDDTPWYNETFLGRTRLETMRTRASIHLFNKDTLRAKQINDEILKYLEKLDVNNKENDPNAVGVVKPWITYRTIVALRFKADMLANSYPEKALQLHKKSLQIKRNNGLLESGLTDIKYIVDYYIARNNFDQANVFAKSGLKEFASRNDDYAWIQLKAKQAEMAFLKGEVDTMRTQYRQVFKKFQRDTSSSLDLHTLKYDHCKPYGNVPIVAVTLKASQHFLEAYHKMAIAEDLDIAYNLSVLANDMFTQNNQDFIYNDQSYGIIEKINEQLLRTAVAQKEKVNIAEALVKIEQTKSNYSWKAFMSSKTKKNLKIPNTALDLEQELRAKIHYYKKSLFIDSDTGNEEKVRVLKANLLDAEKTLDSLNTWYEKRFPQYLSLSQKEFDPSSLQKALKKKQKVIHFVFGVDNVYAFTLTRKTITLKKIGGSASISNDIRKLLKSLERRASPAYKTPAKNLYNNLLTDLVSQNDKEIIFIRDGIMHYLPLEILIDKNDQFLIRNQAVSYANSLHLWDEQIKVKRKRPNKMAIFAPEYSADSLKNPNRNNASQLPGASREASILSDLFDSDTYTSLSSSKDTFMKNASEYEILHLAMHAELNNTNAEFSNLNFSNGEESGKLFVSELYGLKMDANLAVLSACNTGTGMLKNGEGLMNISRAFTYSGVPSLVTSQWKVPDNSTSQLMVAFYRYLKQGMATNKAMQQIKLDYLDTIDDELLKHPYYWAGFVVSGNTSPIESSVSYWWWCLLPLMGIGYALLRKRKLV